MGPQCRKWPEKTVIFFRGEESWTLGNILRELNLTGVSRLD